MVSPDTGKWIVPLKSGCVFPPSAHFSINKLPGNRAILFGGVTMIDGMIHFSNDVFIISFTNKSVVSNDNHNDNRIDCEYL